MNKIITITIITIILNYGLFAQEVIPRGYYNTLGNNNFELSIKFGVENIIIDNTFHIKNYLGTPLLLDNWSKAEVLFNDGKYYNLPNVNYDALDDTFLVYLKHYKPEYNQFASEDFPLITLTDNSLIAISLINEQDTARFVQVSPERFVQKPKTKFFEYFAVEPKEALVLKSIYKKIEKNHMKDMPYSNSLEDYQFLTLNTYYIKNKNKFFVSVHLNKKSVIKAIGDSAAEKKLKKYIKTNHLKMTKPKDVQKLLTYYFDELSR